MKSIVKHFFQAAWKIILFLFWTFTQKILEMKPKSHENARRRIKAL